VFFSPLAIDSVADLPSAGVLEGATSAGAIAGASGGPNVTLNSRVEGGRIEKAGYETFGCPAAVACCDFIAELLQGRTVEQALSITERDLTLQIGGLPEGKEYVPPLVVKAIHQALEGDDKS
jgi:nitrogen fixation NifU-like protein